MRPRRVERTHRSSLSNAGSVATTAGGMAFKSRPNQGAVPIQKQIAKMRGQNELKNLSQTLSGAIAGQLLQPTAGAVGLHGKGSQLQRAGKLAVGGANENFSTGKRPVSNQMGSVKMGGSAGGMGSQAAAAAARPKFAGPGGFGAGASVVPKAGVGFFIDLQGQNNQYKGTRK